MKLSLWVAVQSLASSWNQTLSNATGQWSGELDSFSLLACVKLIPDAVTTKQSCCGNAPHEGDKFDLKSDYKD